MSKELLDKIKNDLEKLTKKELEELKHQAQYWINLKINSSPDTSSLYSEARIFYDVIAEILLLRINEESKSFFIIQKTNSSLYTRIITTHEKVDAFIQRTLPESVKLERRFLYQIFADLVADRIQNSKDYALSLTTMLSFFNNLAGCVDWAYPGYMQSGLLYKVITSSEHRNLDAKVRR